MNQDQFISAHEQQWLILEVLLKPELKPELNPELIARRKKRISKKKAHC